MNAVDMKDAKYALVDETTGQIMEVVGTYGVEDYFAANAYEQADVVRPNWKAEGLKLWLRVGRQ